MQEARDKVIKRGGATDEVANVAELLLGPQGSFITGVDFLVAAAASDEEGLANTRAPGDNITWLCGTLSPAMKSFPKVNPVIEDIK